MIKLCPICKKLPANVQHEHVGGDVKLCSMPGCSLPSSLLHEHVAKFDRKTLEGKRCPVCGIAAIVEHTHVGPGVTDLLEGDVAIVIDEIDEDRMTPVVPLAAMLAPEG